MSEVAKRLRDRRLNVWNEARGYVEKAAEENRTMSAEEEGTWQRLMEELDTIDEKIGGVLSAEKRSKATDDAFNQVTSKPMELRGGSAAVYADSTGRDLNAEIRAIARGEAGSPRAIEVGHNGPFGATELRVLTTSASGSSGVVPTDFYDRLIAHLIEVSGVMQAGPTLLNTSGGENLTIPKTTTHATAALSAQNAAINASDPVFGAPVTLSSYKYGVLTQIARELIDDSGVDLLGYLAMAAGRAVGNAFGSDLILGTGSSAPTGLIKSISGTPGVTGYTATAVTGAALSASNVTIGGPTYSNLIDMEYSVIAPYRQSKSCYWMLRDKSVAALRKLTDTNGRPVWEPSTVLGSPDLLLGKPVVADPYMPAMASGTGIFPLAFGDFSQFFVRLVGGVRFERSDDYAFNTDLVTFRCLIRGDGTLVDTNAIKCFQGGG